MSDALDDLLYDFREFAFDWEGICRKLAGGRYEKGYFQGLAGKHGLRLFVDAFLQTHPAVTRLELPAHPVYQFSDDCVCVSIRQGSQMATTIDTPLKFEGRPLLFDIKLNEWYRLERNYFKDQHPRKRHILDEIFGKERYDHAILVPYAMTRWHAGSNIVRLRFSAEEFRKQADAEGEKWNLLKD